MRQVQKVPAIGLGLILLWLGVIANSPRAHAQISINGGRGLFRVTSGETVNRGNLYVSTFGSLYLKKSGSSLAKDYHGNMTFTYGLFSRIELDGQFVFYQDDQSHIWGPIGDTQIGLKLHIPIESRIIALGVGSKLVFPTAPNHNVPYEPFSADGVGWTPEGYMTLNLTDLIQFPLKIYLNGGYMDHKLLDGLFANKIDETYEGFGFKFPIKNAIFYWELNARQFVHRLSEMALAENWAYSTQGIVFVGPKNLVMNVTLDWRLTHDDPSTAFVPKDYAKWKLWLGITKFIPLRKYATEMADRHRSRAERESLLKRQKQLKKERSKADEEIQRMKELLKKNNPDQPKK